MSTTISMYAASAPAFLRALRNLRQLLALAEAHAQRQGYAAEVLLQARLYPDMLPLLSQVQMATDTAKNGIARLAGEQAPAFADEETDFAGLYARLDRAIDYIGSFAPSRIDGSETRAISLVTRGGERRFEGLPYLTGFALPNLYFHVGTVYALLRHNGVPLGKLDYLGRD